MDQTSPEEDGFSDSDELETDSDEESEEDDDLLNQLYDKFCVDENVGTPPPKKKKKENEQFYHFRVNKNKLERNWLPNNKCKCLVLKNERELFSSNVENFEPLFDEQVKTFKIQDFPFDQGGVRYAFLLKIDGEGDKIFVSKCFKQRRDEVIRQLREDVRLQITAKRIAEEFNRDLEDKTNAKVRLRFIGMDYLVEMEMKDVSQKRKKIWMSVEEFIQKEKDDEAGFTKFSTQLNEVSGGSTKHPLCQTFSHYSCYVTNGYLIVCDIQGILLSKQNVYVLTDPAIHSFVGVDESKKFETSTNFGVEAMKEFLMNHECNEYCRQLGIDSWDYENAINGRTSEIRRKRRLLINSFAVDYDDVEERRERRRKKRAKKEEERKRREEEERRKKEEEEKRRAEEEEAKKRKEEEERRRREEEERRKREEIEREEKRRRRRRKEMEEKMRREGEERQRILIEKRQKLEEMKRKLEEMKLEEKRKKEEAERKRIEEEEKKKQQEEEESNLVMDIMNEIDDDVFNINEIMNNVEEIFDMQAEMEDVVLEEMKNVPEEPEMKVVVPPKKEKKKKKKKRRGGIVGRLVGLFGPICKVKTKKMKV